MVYSARRLSAAWFEEPGGGTDHSLPSEHGFARKDSTSLTSTLHRVHRAFARRVDSAFGALERHPAFLILLLVVIYLPGAFAASAAKPLWHDELFTWYIAQAPTLSQLWAQSRNLDLNPPLVYWLTRLSFHLFGTGALATRLPEIAGFLLFLLASFQFVRHRLGALFGFFAASLLLAGKSLPLAVEARPYTLLLGLLAAALAAWQAARSSSRSGPRILLGVAVIGMLLSHIFAPLAIAALLAAECWAARRDGKPDYAILAALLLPLPIMLTYVPMLRAHAGAIYPGAFQPDANTIFEVYIASIDRELIILCLTALVVLLLFGRSRLEAGAPTEGPAWSFSSPEWVAIVGIMAFPLVLLGWLIFSHAAFFARYAAVETLGVVLLACALLARWTTFEGRRSRTAAGLAAVLALLISGQPFVAASELLSRRLYSPLRGYEPVPAPCEACEMSARPTAAGEVLPLVAASGLIYMEMNHREAPRTLARVFYLTDRQASAAIAHANIFERMDEVAAAFHLRGHVEPYRKFITQHPSFYVLGEYKYPEDWLLPELIHDGATLQLVHEFEPDSYRQTELYLVTLPLDQTDQNHRSRP